MNAGVPEPDATIMSLLLVLLILNVAATGQTLYASALSLADFELAGGISVEEFFTLSLADFERGPDLPMPWAKEALSLADFELRGLRELLPANPGFISLWRYKRLTPPLFPLGRNPRKTFINDAVMPIRRESLAREKSPKNS
ncbi:hypothetical protein [Thermofilum pendens]|uniref:hypothetical protein n=1 Tax=Thermofilum pendens TaxID=2269 RepID=UPI003CCACB27